MSLHNMYMNLICNMFYNFKYFHGRKITTKTSMSIFSTIVLILSISLLTLTNTIYAQNASLSTAAKEQNEDGLGGIFNFANPIINKCYDIAVLSQNMTNNYSAEQNKTSSFLGFCDEGIKKVQDICDQSFNLLAICTNQNIGGYLNLRQSSDVQLDQNTTTVDPCPPGWKMGTSGKCEPLSSNNSLSSLPTSNNTTFNNLTK